MKVPVYYRQPYLQAQGYKNLFAYKKGNQLFYAEVSDNQAVSLLRSPFGSFMTTLEQFPDMLSTISGKLKDNGVDKLIAKCPPPIYEGFVGLEVLMKYEFDLLFQDLNQYIDLRTYNESTLHHMEVRKLVKCRESLRYTPLQADSLDRLHAFISKCRKQQGLAVNITLPLLKSLVTAMPDRYDFFGVYHQELLIAALISVKVTSDIVYYYLPATDEDYKRYSPMVLLLFEAANYYKSRGFTTYDLGVSSFEGVKQEGLYLFKKRMGAESIIKPTLQLDLTKNFFQTS